MFRHRYWLYPLEPHHQQEIDDQLKVSQANLAKINQVHEIMRQSNIRREARSKQRVIERAARDESKRAEKAVTNSARAAVRAEKMAERQAARMQGRMG